MADDGANVPELRFPGFEGEWEFVHLGDVATFGKGKGISKSDIEPAGTTPCLRYGELYTTYDSIIDELVSSTNIPTESLVLSEGGEVVVPASGETAGDIATAATVLRAGVALGGDLNIISSSLNGYFLASYMSGKKRLALAKLAQGNSVVHIYPHHLQTLPLHIAVEAEQQKIAAFLGAVDGKIGQLEKKKALLEDYKKGCMQKLFSRTLRFKDDNGNDFPDWEEKRLGDVAIINPGSDELPTNFTYIDLESVVSGKLNSPPIMKLEDAPSRAQRLLETGDILFQLVRPYQQNNLFFKLYGPHVASTGYAQVRAHKSKEFLFQALYRHEFLNEVLKRCTGTSYPAINSNDLREINILIPRSLKEQQKIANFLTAIDDKITLTTTQLTQAQTFKKGLLQQMFV